MSIYQLNQLWTINRNYISIIPNDTKGVILLLFPGPVPDSDSKLLISIQVPSNEMIQLDQIGPFPKTQIVG